MSGEVKKTSVRRLAFNYALLSGGEAVSKVFAFVSFAYLARLLGPDSYGDVEFALAVMMFFTLIVEGGLGLLGAREIAKDEGAVGKLTFHIVMMRLAFAAAAFAMLLLFAELSNKTGQERLLVVLYGLTLFSIPGFLQWVFQGLDRMQWVAIASVIRWTLFAGLVFFFIADPAHVWLVPIAELAAVSAVFVFNFAVFRRFFGGFWRRFDVPYAWELLRQGIPIGMTQVMWGLRAYLPLIMLGLIIGGDQVGWFGAANRVVVALHSFVWMYFFNLYPSISRCSNQEPGELRRLLGKSMQMTAWAGVFIGLTGTLLAGPAMTIVYGGEFTEAAASFKFIIWIITFILVSGHYMYTLLAFNKQWYELVTSLCGAVVSFTLNLVFITRYGYMGAAVALLLTEVVILALNYAFVRKSIAHVPFLPHMIRPAIAGVVMTVLVLLLPPVHFMVVGAASAAFYFVGILILQPGLINDVRLFLSGNR